MPEMDFQQFRLAVLADPALQQDLRNIGDQAQFIDAVVTKGVQMGFEITDKDVEAAMRDGRRSWIERWI